MNRTLGQRLALHTSVLGLAYLLARVLDVPFRIIAANLLGEEGFGDFRFAMTLAAFAAFAADLGLDPYTTRRIPRMTDPQSELPGIVRIRLLNTMFMVFGFLAVAAVLRHFTEADQRLLVWSLLYALILTALAFSRALIRGFEKMAIESLGVTTEKVVLVTAGLAIVWFWREAEGLLTAFALAGLVSVLYMATRVVRLTGRAAFVPRRGTAAVWHEAWAFGVGALILMGLYREDIFLLYLLRGDAETGIYGSPFLVLEGLLLPAQMAAFALLPVISDGWHRRENVGPVVSRVLGILMLLAAPAAVGGALVSGDLMALLFPKLSGSLPDMTRTFTILVATLPFLCGNYVIGTVLLAVDRQRYNLACSAVAFLLNLGLNLLLIPEQGSAGAATATLLTQGVFLLLLAWGARDCVEWSLSLTRTVGFCLSLAAMAGTVVVLGELHVLARIAAGAVVFVGVALGTATVRTSELKGWRG